ncbi:MAG: hypothetical protein EZS26_004083 [Candidatus Ordinivivax streblomastigis]|uniref:Uncharacterized protein n=1 Tax=Candidatus Ordinivivax streblomastigis TaxID=2540710 RepID=A0A5M8NRJ6_9BACT|nr:MAG: hypothetical protein EZS26_004083 [Candidatus Ordinivivax streblomastigis]
MLQTTGMASQCDFIHGTAVNRLEMSQKDTFDPNTIDH